MALIYYYDATGVGLFNDIGSLIKLSDVYAVDQGDASTGVAAEVQVILDQYGDNDFEGEIADLTDDRTTWEAEYTGRRSDLVAYSTARLLVYDNLTEVGSSTASISEVIPLLIEAMNADAGVPTVNASVATVPTNGTADAGNNGDGVVVLSKVLDGATSPGTGFNAHPDYKDLLTELVDPSDTLRIRCTADSFQNSQVEGQESFAITGNPANTLWGPQVEGTGSGGALATTVATSILTDGAFENFTANDPDSWDIVNGTAGVHIFKDITAANVVRGSSSLQLTGDGAQAEIEVKQDISVSQVTANKRYICTFWVKGDAAIVAGDLNVSVNADSPFSPNTNTGDNFSALHNVSQADEKIKIDAATLASLGWSLAFFFVNIRSEIPSSYRMKVRWHNTPTSGKNIWIDDLTLSPLTFVSGVGVAIAPGGDPFTINDRFTAAVSNTEGIVQRWFRRAYGVQLPSNAAAGETIPDSVAT